MIAATLVPLVAADGSSQTAIAYASAASTSGFAGE